MPQTPPSLKSLSRSRRAGASKFPSQTASSALESRFGAQQTSFYQVPTPLTPLIGREREIRDLSELLRRSEVRLVTLSGTGGIGKTRLAWQISADLQASFPAGCHFVSLAALRAVELVVPTIIQSLGLPKAEHRSSVEHLIAFLRDQHLLLVLDNFEQLVAAAPTLMEILSACTGVKLLLTSRTVLHVQGEYEFRVPPLGLPDLNHLAGWEDLAQYPAITLFLERARGVQPVFQFDDSTARPIAEICARLDGLPLAIELAAARIKVFAPDALLRRLEHRLEVLTGGGPDLSERQQTLRSTISWSYDLLVPEEQWLFRQLAIFAGGSSLQAIEAVWATRGGATISALDLATALLDHSMLVRSEDPGGEPRFSLYETLREFGQERLVAEGELEQGRQTHAAYYQALVEEAEPSLFGFPPAGWLTRIERDYGNVRAALEYLLERNAAEAALRLSGILGSFWFFRGNLSEGRQFLDRALAISNEAPAPVAERVQASAFYMAGWLALWQLDFIQAAPLLAESLRIFQALQDQAGQAAALNLLSAIEDTWGNNKNARDMSEDALRRCKTLGEQRGVAAVLLMRGMQSLFQGEFALTQRYCSESLEIFGQVGDPWGMAANLHYLGWACYCQRDIQCARRYTEASVAHFRSFGIPSFTAEAVTILGCEVAAQGEVNLAVALFEEALVLGQAVGNPITSARVLCGMGHVALYQEQAVKAQSLFEKSILLLKDLEGFTRAQWVLASCLEGMGEIAWSRQQPAWAARLLSAAAARCTVKDSVSFLRATHPNFRRVLEGVRTHLGKATFARLEDEVRTMTAEQFLNQEGQALQIEQDFAGPTPSADGDLTPREAEVLALITRGLTNKEIAKKLVLSPHTVNIHVQAIYRKLDVSSRAAATRHALEHRLVCLEDPK